MEILFYSLLLVVLTIAAFQDVKTRRVSDWLVIVAWFLAYLENPPTLRLMVFAFAFLWGLEIMIKNKGRTLARWGDLTFAPVLIGFVAMLLTPLSFSWLFFSYWVMFSVAVISVSIIPYLTAYLKLPEQKEYPGFFLFWSIYLVMFVIYLFYSF
jgi:hypothetical protein